MAMDLVILIWPLWTIGNPTAGQAPMWFFKERIDAVKKCISLQQTFFCTLLTHSRILILKQ